MGGVKVECRGRDKERTQNSEQKGERGVRRQASTGTENSVADTVATLHYWDLLSIFPRKFEVTH